MNLRKNVTNVIATSAILLGMTSGLVSAQPAPEDTEEAVLNMTCPAASFVEVDIDREFSINAADGFSGYIGNTPYYSTNVETDLVVVELDLTCNWVTDWSVDVVVGDFENPSAPATSAGSFPGSHLYLRGGDFHGLGYEGPTFNYLGLLPGPSAGAPEINANVTGGIILGADGQMIDDGSYDGWFIDIPRSSPGITTAAWNGQLQFLPANLADGQYIADLTVTLSVD